jgi:hypothetical protein
VRSAAAVGILCSKMQPTPCKELLPLRPLFTLLLLQFQNASEQSTAPHLHAPEPKKLLDNFCHPFLLRYSKNVTAQSNSKMVGSLHAGRWQQGHVVLQRLDCYHRVAMAWRLLMLHMQDCKLLSFQLRASALHVIACCVVHSSSCTDTNRVRESFIQVLLVQPISFSLLQVVLRMLPIVTAVFHIISSTHHLAITMHILSLSLL